MKYLTLDVFDNFKCIGSNCPDTCCAGWAIYVDDDSAQNYMNETSEFGDKLRTNLFKQDNHTFMKLINQRCAFLTDENLCEIYIRLGEHAMCHICQTYPRFSDLYGDISFQGLGISCPVVAQKVLYHKSPIQFDLSEDNIPLPHHNTVNWEKYNTYIFGLTTSIGIIQDRTFTLSQRLRLLVFFNDALQQHFDNDLACNDLFQTFSPENLREFLPLLNTLPNTHDYKLKLFTFMQKNLSTLKSPKLLSYINTSIDNLHNLDLQLSIYELFTIRFMDYLTPDTEPLYEQYCVYFLFHHYMDGFNSQTPLKSVTLFVYMYILNLCLSIFKLDPYTHTLTTEQQIDIFVSTARTFEHSVNDWKLNELYNLCNNNSMTDTTFLLNLLA